MNLDNNNNHHNHNYFDLQTNLEALHISGKDRLYMGDTDKYEIY